MRDDPSTIDTKDLKHCPACRAEARESDRFCRRCGAAHNVMLNLRVTDELVFSPPDGIHLPPCNTNPRASVNTYHRVSGSLVKTIVEGVSANAGVYLDNYFTRLMLPVLLVVPIWLIIILLSPLDAYVTAKTITK